jgi:hypothetical protein
MNHEVYDQYSRLADQASGFKIGACPLWATAAINSTADQGDNRKAQEWLGHATIATTRIDNHRRLARRNGAEPKITNISPDASDVRLWAASMPDQNDEKAYIECMLESKVTDLQFFFFQADNVRTVKEIAEIVCSDSKWQTLSQISLETYLGSLMLLRQ